MTSKIAMPDLAQKLRQKIAQFRELLPPSPDELKTFAEATLALDELSRRAIPTVQNPTSRLMEDIQNAADTAQVILNQPLDVIGGTHANISLVNAAREFTEKDPDSSDLAKISRTFAAYAEQTQSLKVELQLTIEDLDRDIA